MTRSPTTDADAAPSVGVVVVAAGSGSRLGAKVPKAFVPVLGRPLLAYAVDTALRVPGLCSLVAVVPQDRATVRHPDYADGWWPARGALVAGGAERTDSVAAGLAALDPACEVVLVHDAARCFTPLAVFERVVSAVVAGAAGSVPGLPVVDTVKIVDAAGVVTSTPERASLRAIQTPQAFRADVLRAAYGSGAAATDDAALVESLGHQVVVVEGDPRAFKVTTAPDLAHAERIARERDENDRIAR